MARVPVTVTVAPGGYTGGFAEVSMAAGDTADGNTFPLTGREILVLHNTSADTAYHWNATSVADRAGREADIVEEDIAFGDIVIFGPIPLEGWQQTDGAFYFDVENTAIEVGVIRY